jgi:hypothetical protein
MDDANFYLYCIARRQESGVVPALYGQRGAPVLEIPFRDIAAYASKTDLSFFEPTIENLECHEWVITELMKTATVLPMSFSTLMKPEAQIINMLDKYYGQFKENLSRVDGKLELGIKVFCKLNFETEDKPDLNRSCSPKDYMMKLYEKYHERKKQMDAVLARIDAMHEKLSSRSCESCRTKPIKNNLIFNASYLVWQDAKAEFDKAVEEIQDIYADYKIIYSGPWPTYNFIKIVQENQE